MLIYSDAVLIDCFQVKTRPGVRSFVQNFRPVYEKLAASVIGQVIMDYDIGDILLSISTEFQTRWYRKSLILLIASEKSYMKYL